MNKIRDIDRSLINQNEISLCYTLLFGKENINAWLTVITPIFLMQQESTSYQPKVLTFRSLNKSNKCKCTSTTHYDYSNKWLNAFWANIPFLFLFIYSFASQTYQAVLYLEINLVCTTFYWLYFYFVCIYVIIQTVHKYVYEQKKKLTKGIFFPLPGIYLLLYPVYFEL